MPSLRNVALPTAVTPSISKRSKLSWKCSPQASSRGLKSDTIRPVLESRAR